MQSQLQSGMLGNIKKGSDHDSLYRLSIPSSNDALIYLMSFLEAYHYNRPNVLPLHDFKIKLIKTIVNIYKNNPSLFKSTLIHFISDGVEEFQNYI